MPLRLQPLPASCSHTFCQAGMIQQEESPAVFKDVHGLTFKEDKRDESTLHASITLLALCCRNAYKVYWCLPLCVCVCVCVCMCAVCVLCLRVCCVCAVHVCVCAVCACVCVCLCMRVCVCVCVCYVYACVRVEGACVCSLQGLSTGCC